MTSLSENLVLEGLELGLQGGHGLKLVQAPVLLLPCIIRTSAPLGKLAHIFCKRAGTHCHS